MIIEIQTCDSSSGPYEVCIYPRETRRKRAAWILWVSKDGSGTLYTKRAESGATLDNDIQLPPNVSRKKISDEG